MANLERQHEDYQRYLKYKRDDLFQVPSDDKFVWFNPDPKNRDSFASAAVLQQDKEEWVLRTEEGHVVTIKVDFITPRNPAKFDGVEDLNGLGYLNEAGVLHDLRIRYNKNVIYTYAGLFLVAINPYRQFPIYTDSIIEIYKGRRRNELAPHIFAVADDAYRSMLGDKLNQSILLTGESGAGKTENTKRIIQYLIAVAGRASTNPNHTSLEAQILHANTILESFGNAKTTKNNNSSRFSKFIEVQFNSAGCISGAKIQSYLLEKSRVGFLAENERSFHIFYQLLAGASPEERRSLFLDPPYIYQYLNQSGCFDVADVNDANDFKDTKAAFKIMNISDEEQEAIFRVISGILHLGNIAFSQSHEGAAAITDKTSLNYAAAMFNVTASQLEKALTEPRVQAGKGLFVSLHLTLAKANSGRDALAKAIYHRLFLWIIKKINLVLCQEKHMSFIGVLDISGFEIFKTNSLQQLCINYANEKLQQFFNHHMFTLEQEEYKKERLDWTFIDFGMDSQATINLIESVPLGILTMLDEQSVFPNGTDQILITKLHTLAKKHPKYDVPRFSDKSPTFGIYHYADTVSYDVTNWLEKNKDLLQPDLEATMKDSQDTFVHRLFTEHFEELPNFLKTKFVTVAGQYKSQLNNLMGTLQATHPHFVRCILPNRQQKPGFFEDACVLDQLRCNGVLEGIRITRLGFPDRVFYADFVKRYYLLVPNVPRNPIDPKPVTTSILKGLDIPECECCFGLTKIFFRTGQLAYIDELRERRIGAIVKVVQAASRGWVERKRFWQARGKSVAARIIQDNIRAYLEFKNWPWWKLFAKARPLINRRNVDKELRERDAHIRDLNSQLTAEKAARSELERQINEVDNKIAQLEAALKAEKRKVTNLQDTNTDLKHEVTNLERKVSYLENDLAEQTKLVYSITVARSEAEDKVKELSAALEEEKEASLNIEMAKRKVEDLFDQGKRQHELDTERINTLEKLKMELQAEVEELSDQFAGETRSPYTLIAKQKRKLDRYFDDLEQKYQEEVTARCELNKVKNQLDNDLKSTTTQLESEVKHRRILEGNQKKLEAALAAETAKFEVEQKKNTALEKVNKILEQQQRDLTQELDDEKKNKEALEEARKALETYLNDLRTEEVGGDMKVFADLNKKVDEELEALREQIEELKKNVQNLAKAKRNLEAQVAETTTALETSQAENGNLQQIIKKLEEEFEALNKKLAYEQHERENLAQAKKNAEQDLKDLKANLDDVSASRGALDQMLKQTEERLENAKVEFERERKTRQQFENSKKLLETKLHTLQGQLNDEKKKWSDLEVVLAQVHEEFEMELNAHKVISNAKAKLAADYEELKKLAEADLVARHKAQEQIQNLQHQINVLEIAAQDAEATVEKFGRQCHTLEDDLKDVQDKLDKEKNQRVKFQKQFRKFEEELRQAKLGIDCLTATTFNQYMALKRLKEDNANQHLELVAFDEKTAQFNRERKQMKRQLKDLEIQLDDAIAARIKLEKQKKDLEAEIEDLEDSAAELHKKQQEVDELKNHLAVEIDRKTKDEETKKILRKELQTIEEDVEDLKRNKLNSENIRKKLEGEVEDLQTSLSFEQGVRKKFEQLAKQLFVAKVVTQPSSNSDYDFNKLQEELTALKNELESEKALRITAEKRERVYKTEIYALQTQLDEEICENENDQFKRRRCRAELEEWKGQVEELEAQLVEAEEAKHRKDMELEEVKRKIEGESQLTIKFEENSKRLEQEIHSLKIQLEEERDARVESEHERKMLEAEIDDLNLSLDKEIKFRQRTEKARKKIDAELKVNFIRLDAESINRTQPENLTAMLEEEIARLKEDLDDEVKQKTLIDRTRKSLELQLDATRTQMNLEARARASADERSRQAENELKDLHEQLDALVEISQDLESAKVRLEGEEIKKNSALEAAEIARTII